MISVPSGLTQACPIDFFEVADKLETSLQFVHAQEEPLQHFQEPLQHCQCLPGAPATLSVPPRSPCNTVSAFQEPLQHCQCLPGALATLSVPSRSPCNTVSASQEPLQHCQCLPCMEGSTLNSEPSLNSEV